MPRPKSFSPSDRQEAIWAAAAPHLIRAVPNHIGALRDFLGDDGREAATPELPLRDRLDTRPDDMFLREPWEMGE